jgi:methionine-S-sulfoxide reductase
MSQADKNEKIDLNNPNFQVVTFAGGCFWCMEPPYDNISGVISTTVGYSGGKTVDPTYEEVSTGKTGHTEAVQIVFDTTKITYWALLQTFWRNIDPTNPFGQFADRGSQYRTAIFYHDDKQKKLAIKSKEELEKSGKFEKPIVTEIVPFTKFYPAEEYHQEYYKKHPLRYNSYKVGSGRAGYIKNVWGDEK